MLKPEYRVVLIEQSTQAEMSPWHARSGSRFPVCCLHHNSSGWKGNTGMCTGFGVLLTFVLLMVSTSQTIAQETDSSTLSQDIVGGDFSYGLTSGTMESITFDHAMTGPSMTDGSLSLLVSDQRGTYEGWTIAIESTAFVYNGQAPGTHDIPAANARVTPGAPVALGGQGLGGLQVAAGGSLATRQTVLTAIEGTGSGRFAQDIGIQLSIPAQQPAGAYTAMITVTSSAAPSSAA